MVDEERQGDDLDDLAVFYEQARALTLQASRPEEKRQAAKMRRELYQKADEIRAYLDQLCRQLKDAARQSSQH